MLILKNLILNEYFPSELPDCFSTKNVIPHLDIIKGKANASNIKSSFPFKFSGFKSESARRKFAVPNFYHYLKAADFVVDKQTEILNITDSTNHSLTSPRKKNSDSSYAFSKLSYRKKDTKEIVEKMYQDNAYMIKLDISSFFDSIYTHSLAWAIHTKKIAKKTRNNSLWGNELDSRLRAFNSEQTNGVLVGNAISRIAAEIILCTIDKSIEKKFNELQYVRFVDDYYIFVKNEADIQPIITFIRQQLSEYELILNENKISIIPSPFLFDAPWVDELKLHLHNAPDTLLNKSFALYKEYADLSIFKYVLQVVSVRKIESTEWDCIESKIFNLWAKAPSLSELIIYTLLQNKDVIHRSKLKNTIYTNIEKCLAFNLQQELVWMIWSLKVFNINIKQDIAVQILESQNDLAIIILLDCIHSGIVKKTSKITSAINSKRQELINLDTDDDGNIGALLWTQHWLLAYESQFHQWLDVDNEKFEIVNNNDFYKKLLSLGVSFYDTTYNMMAKEPRKFAQKYKYHSELQELLTVIQKAVDNKQPNSLEEIRLASESVLSMLGDNIY